MVPAHRKWQAKSPGHACGAFECFPGRVPCCFRTGTDGRGAAVASCCSPTPLSLHVTQLTQARLKLSPRTEDKEAERAGVGLFSFASSSRLSKSPFAGRGTVSWTSNMAIRPRVCLLPGRLDCNFSFPFSSSLPSLPLQTPPPSGASPSFSTALTRCRLVQAISSRSGFLSIREGPSPRVVWLLAVAASWLVVSPCQACCHRKRPILGGTGLDRTI